MAFIQVVYLQKFLFSLWSEKRIFLIKFSY